MSELYDRDYQVLFRRLTQTEVEKRFFVPVPDTGVSVRPPIAIQFSCEKTLKRQPNTLDLKLFNLSDATRAELQRPGVVLRFSAGYVSGGARRLFVGDVQWAYSQLKGTEWITSVQVGDGSRAFSTARSDGTFRSGTKVIDVLKFVAKTMTLTVPTEIAVTKVLQQQFAAGYQMSAKSRDELDRLLAPYGYSWSIQDGVLRVLRDEDTSSVTMREISAATGMIDSPEFGNPEGKSKTPKVTVSSKLYPELQPGGKVNIISRDLNGVHKITKVRHTGDTQTDDWKTQVEVEPIRR